MSNSRLCRVISAESLSILVQTHGGGRYLYVPESTASARHIEILIGLPETCSLVAAFGGDRIYLPLDTKTGPNKAAPSIAEVARLSASMSGPQIARQFGCSVRTIAARRAAHREGRKDQP
jgi:hypothetical protein